MLKKLLLFLFFPLSVYCQTAENENMKMIGDIAYDSTVDKKDFMLCNRTYIYQYFNGLAGLQFEGEKIALIKIFMEQYKCHFIGGESGLIRIRFVVNCKGEIDRFRVIGMNEKYEIKNFDQYIVKQLLQITRNLKGWKIKTYENKEIDYYQYLIFKIENGQLKEILP